MALARFEVAVAADTLLPRDRCVNVLHFNIQQIPLVSPSPNLDQLCHDLAQIYSTTWHNDSREIKVTAYDDQGTKPVYPSATYVQDEGLAPASDVPREVALCLSFYADRNIPRHRGRIYLPLCTSFSSATGVRPSQGIMDAALDMATAFKNLGGADVDWQIRSTRDSTSRNVQQAWVDDEWDTMRSRGMRATRRTQRAIGE